jgi:hypothetical protein
MNSRADVLMMDATLQGRWGGVEGHRRSAEAIREPASHWARRCTEAVSGTDCIRP